MLLGCNHCPDGLSITISSAYPLKPRRALEINPNSYEAWYERGKLLMNEDEDEAIESLDKALEINSNSHEAWLKRGGSSGFEGINV